MPKQVFENGKLLVKLDPDDLGDFIISKKKELKEKNLKDFSQKEKDALLFNLCKILDIEVISI